jgi:hypothetical protein
MKKLLFALLAASLVSSCTQDLNEKCLSAITPFVETSIGKENKIDEISILKVDTATMATQLKLEMEHLTSTIGYKGEINKINMGAVERAKDDYEQFPITELYNRVKRAEQEYNDYYQNEIKPIVDDMNRIDSLYKLADTTKFLAYDVLAILKYTTPEKVQKKDTISVIVNKDFRVIERMDFWQNKF